MIDIKVTKQFDELRHLFLKMRNEGLRDSSEIGTDQAGIFTLCSSFHYGQDPLYGFYAYEIRLGDTSIWSGISGEGRNANGDQRRASGEWELAGPWQKDAPLAIDQLIKLNEERLAEKLATDASNQARDERSRKREKAALSTKLIEQFYTTQR
jgi:hypothetical protein